MESNSTAFTSFATIGEKAAGGQVWNQSPRRIWHPLESDRLDRLPDAHHLVLTGRNPLWICGLFAFVIPLLQLRSFDRGLVALRPVFSVQQVSLPQ